MKIAKILCSKIYIFICLIVLMFLLFSIINNKYKNKSVQEKFYEMQKQIEQLEKEKQALLEQQDYFKTDVYFEREARSKLSLKKPGEEVMFVKPLENSEQSNVSGSNSKNNSQASGSRFENLIKWFKYFAQ